MLRMVSICIHVFHPQPSNLLFWNWTAMFHRLLSPFGPFRRAWAMLASMTMDKLVLVSMVGILGSRIESMSDLRQRFWKNTTTTDTRNPWEVQKRLLWLTWHLSWLLWDFHHAAKVVRFAKKCPGKALKLRASRCQHLNLNNLHRVTCVINAILFDHA